MKTIFILLFAITVANPSWAQKNYSTTNAEVHFIAVDDSDIDAVNKNAVSRLQANGDMSFIMLIKDFTFEMESMQKHFNEEYLESDQFPRAFFNGKITNFSSVNFAKDGKYPITVAGSMQVHGVNKAMETKGVIVITKGLPKATAKFRVSLKDFGIGGVLIEMVADQVDVEVVASYQ